MSRCIFKSTVTLRDGRRIKKVPEPAERNMVEGLRQTLDQGESIMTAVTFHALGESYLRFTDWETGEQAWYQVISQ